MSFSYSQTEISELISEFTDPRVREAVELASLPGILCGASYFIDVGANVGQYTFNAARHLRNAALLAIEANPFLIPVLETTIENLRTNGLSGNSYDVRAAAVSDRPGPLEFYVSKYPTLSSLFPKASSERVYVPTVALDEFYRQGIPTVIKIDVEGAEYRAICSASRFLRCGHASFFVELHSWGDQTIGKYPVHVCWLFLRNGYALRKIGSHYLFERAPWITRNLAFLAAFPSLFAKYFVRRFAEPAAARLESILARMRHS